MGIDTEQPAVQQQNVVVLYSLDRDWDRQQADAAIANAVSVADALEQAGIESRLMAIHDDIFSALSHLDPNELVFNLVCSLHGVPNGDVLAATMLEESDLAHTGSDYVCLDQCRDKFHLNSICRSVGIRVPEATLVLDEDQDLSHVQLPAIVKPNHGARSMGINVDSVVYDHDTLRQRTGRVWQEYGQPPVVESYIAGRELHVAVLGNSQRRILPVIEICFEGLPQDIPQILGTSCRCPAQLSKQLRREVELSALRAMQIADCRDYALVEFRVDSNDLPHLIEINPNPDFGPGSAFGRALDAAGIGLDDFATRLIRWTTNRVERSGQLKAGFGA
ncbi:MAG: ATP-grasp domain-containing protein [Candidatus Alcyoniella australis]|nr:ATP-grasp domain-containing protein [Candidatus Alcyoniella australis]